MFAPGQRFYHPDGTEITDLVLEALREMSRPNEPVILEREQAEMARMSGNLAREFMGGHSVAMIHEDVFDQWVRQRGLDETLNGVVPYLTKKFPSIGMKYQPAATKLHVHRSEAPSLSSPPTTAVSA